MAPERPGHGPHRADDGGLGDAVRGRDDAADHPRGARRADDGAGLARHHDARCVLDPGHGGPRVGRHGAVVVGEVEGRDGVHGHGPRDTCMVVHDVEPAVARHREVDGRGDLRLVRDVAAGLAGVRPELGGDSAAKVVLDVGEDHLGAVPDELRGSRLANATGSARDYGHLPGQPL